MSPQRDDGSADRHDGVGSIGDPSRTSRFRRMLVSSREAITPLGWLVIALTGLGLFAGAGVRWVEGWFFAILGGILLLLALPFLLGSRAYRTAIEVGTGRVTAGGELRVGVRIVNTSRRPQLPAIAELPVGDALRELVIPGLGGGGTIELPIEFATERRGVVPVGPLTVARQDPLGLLRREVRWREWHLVHVHPRTVALPPHSAGLVRDLEGQASRRLSDADLSFHAVREYAPGDAVRHIHWKSTAKTGALMVRQYEESQTARVAVLFDARSEEYADPEEFELAVSIAASLSVQAVRERRERFIVSSGARRGALRQNDWPPGASHGRGRPWPRRAGAEGFTELPSLEREQLLDAWAELGPDPDGLPIEAFARRLADSRRALSIVALITGSVPSLSRIRQAVSAFPPDVAVLALRADLLAPPRAQRIDRLTLLTVGALEDVPGLMMRGIR